MPPELPQRDNRCRASFTHRVTAGARVVVFFLCAAPAIGQSPAASPSVESAHWQQITALQCGTPASQPAAQRFAAELSRRTALLGQVRSYLMQYPGGQHRDEAVCLELLTLFEIGCLRGGGQAELCQRVDEYLRSPASDAVRAEAAYWQSICQRLARVTSASQPSSQPVLPADLELLDAQRAYLREHRRSRLAPRLTALLFEAALQRGDREEMRALVGRLKEDFPDHATTTQLHAALQRVEAVGKPFWLAFGNPDGSRIDSRELTGQPVLIVVWAGFDEAARGRVGQIEEFRRSHDQLRVLGVNLDDTPEAGAAVATALNIRWPQCNDGLGWANEFVRQWGVRSVPFVFAIDRAGRLVGATGGADWAKLAETALQN